MGITIRFVGGPADGHTYATPDETPPWLYFVPLAPSLADLMADPLDPSPIQTAEYEARLERGRPHRAGDGAYLYEHRAAPLTPEQQTALTEGRRRVKAAEERRATELDAAWREVRKERPDFPEDWRDAF